MAQAPSYPALLLTQNDQRFFLTTIPVNDLFKYCFVSRRDEDPINGFQRTLNEARAEDIANYLSRGNGSIPTNIVLSAQENSRFRYSRKTKAISYERREKSFLVLDGQHRLWGYSICFDRFALNHRVPVAIYENLTLTDETKIFIDINTLQRGVPATLLLDIKAMAQIESDLERTLRGIFDSLSADKDSALAGRLTAAKPVRGKIQRVTFNRAVSRALKSAILNAAKPDQLIRAIRNYVNAFDAEISDKALLVKPVFFEAMFEIFDDVTSRTLAEHGNIKQINIQKTIRPLGKVDFNQLGGHTKLTASGLAYTMRSTLQKNTNLTASML